ncbi:hypothetical protein [Ideonella sp. BN130291]|uniref:hypothetical protein n=1 Tax=Ideonella sp. BN130291 TaxID=3112940 RepID=UPI002E26A55F|nr:hypothetical protein [Ideonella sp. BN130291]
MRTLARLLALWLIAVALPIQGVAAATMLHCAGMPSHEAAVAGPGDHHEGHGGHHHAGAATEPAGDAHATHHPAGGKHSCSACASCCSATALPAMPLLLVSQGVTEPLTPDPERPLVAFLTGGPERPPRTTSL